MGEKETDSAGESEQFKPKTKSNQSNDRTDADAGGALDSDGELVADDSDPAAAQMLKNKTKSNQSNDRMDAGDGGDLDDDGAELDVSDRAKWTTSNPGIGRAAAGDGGITHNDDWHDNAAKLAPERTGKSEIAIGEPGSNNNLGVTDPGVGPATPKKTN